MAKPRKRYVEDDFINGLIWDQLQEYRWVSISYLARKTQLSFAVLEILTEGLPKVTKLKLKHHFSKMRKNNLK